MDKYAINEKGVQDLKKLSESILTNLYEIIESGEKLKNIIASFGNEFGIYEDDINLLVGQTLQIVKISKEDMVYLSKTLAAKANEILELMGEFEVNSMKESKYESGLIDSSNKLFAQPQTEHKKMIVSADDRIDAIVADIFEGAGEYITREKAEAMHTSIRDYSGTLYSAIRKAYTNLNVPQELKNEMACLDEYLEKAPKWEGPMLRGINVSKYDAKKILSGPNIDMLGPSSWSSEERTAQNFSLGNLPINMVFVLAGGNTQGASITHLSSLDGIESEITVPSGVKYIKDKVETLMVNGKKYVYVHVHEKR